VHTARISRMAAAAFAAFALAAEASPPTAPARATSSPVPAAPVAGASAPAPAAAAPAASTTAPAPAAAAPAAGATAPAPAQPAEFSPIDLPEWAIVHTSGPTTGRPWILIVDDPQCPYCMQFLLALEKARESGDAEIASAAVVTLPYPLVYHDQSAHILADAFCLEASRANRPWGAGPYLDWLMVESWKADPGWKSASLDDLGKDGGFFDAGYEAHRVTSSRRREYQTAVARTEAACGPGSCTGDADCEKLCAESRTCRAACPQGAVAPSGSAATPAGADREKCLADCSSSFVSKRYRQFSKIHSACLMKDGPGSAHAKVAAAFAWAVEHKIPGTPTIYAGSPSIGFRVLGDSDDLSGLMKLLRSALAETRLRLSATTAH
jgi:hypothetical protein